MIVVNVHRPLRIVCGVGVALLVLGCAAPHFFTMTIYESPGRVVKLQAVPDANEGKGFSHPADVSEEQMKAAMRGLYVEIPTTPWALPFMGSGEGGRQRAFSEKEIELFAPLFVKALAQATPEELVTFYENAEVDDQYELTTSGGLFVTGEELHFLISNFNVKTRIWQDNEQYEAPYHLRPMEPMDPQPGRLVFDPASLMIVPQKGLFDIGLTGEPWQVGVRYKELP